MSGKIWKLPWDEALAVHLPVLWIVLHAVIQCHLCSSSGCLWWTLSLFPLDGRCHVGNLLPRSRSSSSLNSEKTAQKQLRMSPSREVPWTETRPNFLALPFSSCKTTAKSSISGPTATSSHSRLWECNENASWIIPGMKTGTHKLALLEVYLLPHLPNSLLSIVREMAF